MPLNPNVYSDLDRLPSENSSIDVAIAIAESSDFPPQSLLNEIQRAVKPGGKAVMVNSASQDLAPSLENREEASSCRNLRSSASLLRSQPVRDQCSEAVVESRLVVLAEIEAEDISSS